MLINAETHTHTHTQANSHYNGGRDKWNVGSTSPLSFCLPPWWCVMFRGDNRCHGETPLVSALWGTLMTRTHTNAHAYTHSTVWAQAAHSLDHGNHQWFSTPLTFLYLHQFLSFSSSLSLSSSLLLSRTHIHLPHFWTAVPLADQTSSSPLKSLCLFLFVSNLQFLSTLSPDVKFNIGLIGSLRSNRRNKSEKPMSQFLIHNLIHIYIWKITRHCICKVIPLLLHPNLWCQQLLTYFLDQL